MVTDIARVRTSRECAAYSVGKSSSIKCHSPFKLIVQISQVDLQSLFGLLFYSCTHWLRPRNSPLPPPQHLGSYTRTLFVNQDRRHLFVTPWPEHKMACLEVWVWYWGSSSVSVLPHLNTKISYTEVSHTTRWLNSEHFCYKWNFFLGKVINFLSIEMKFFDTSLEQI